jgi:hypothetical protein
MRSILVTSKYSLHPSESISSNDLAPIATVHLVVRQAGWRGTPNVTFLWRVHSVDLRKKYPEAVRHRYGEFRSSVMPLDFSLRLQELERDGILEEAKLERLDCYRRFCKW